MKGLTHEAGLFSRPKNDDEDHEDDAHKDQDEDNDDNDEDVEESGDNFQNILLKLRHGTFLDDSK